MGVMKMFSERMFFKADKAELTFWYIAALDFGFLCWAAKGAVFFTTACNYSAVAAEGEWSCSSFPPAATWMLLLFWALLLQLSVPADCLAQRAQWEIPVSCPSWREGEVPAHLCSLPVHLWGTAKLTFRSWTASACQAPQSSRQQRVNCSVLLHMCWTDHIWLL